MGDNIGLIQLNEVQVLIQPLELDGYYKKTVRAPRATPPVRKLRDLSR